MHCEYVNFKFYVSFIVDAVLKCIMSLWLLFDIFCFLFRNEHNITRSIGTNEATQLKLLSENVEFRKVLCNLQKELIDLLDVKISDEETVVKGHEDIFSSNQVLFWYYNNKNDFLSECLFKRGMIYSKLFEIVIGI